MKTPFSTVFKYIHSFYHNSFRLGYLLLVITMLAALICFNYYHTSFRQLIANPSWTQEFLLSYALYFVPFALAFLFQYFFYHHNGYLKNKKLWALIIFAPAIFALRVNFNFHHDIIERYFSGNKLQFWTHCFDWIVRASVVLGIIFFATKYINPQVSYSPKGLTNAKIYPLMALCLLPFIVLAALQPSFQHVYPRAQLIERLHLPEKPLYYIAFELSYAFDFISIESFFRGFLLFAFMRICGMNCIVPAACFYCCIHFGKPMGEAISSFWGGLLLGIVSYHTKNIWGGVMVHIGIAAMMEAAGFLVV